MADATIYESTIINIKKFDEFTYLLTFTNTEEFPVFYASLYTYFKPLIIKEENEGDDILLTVTLQSVQTLKQYLAHKKQYLSYQDCLHFFKSIGRQLKYLERNKKTLLTFDLDNIIIFNDSFYLYMEPDNTIFSIRDDTILIDKLLVNTPFSSPTIKNIKEIPHTLRETNNWMYSLGSIIGYCLTHNKDFKKRKFDSKLSLEMIQDTPLYFALLRCLETTSFKRFYYYI